MARKSETQRRKEQRERQQKLRDRNKAEKRPGRDDIARVLLVRVIAGLLKDGRRQKLDELGDRLVEELVAQGFDERAAYEVFDNFVEKYASGDRGFRRKTHLLFPGGLVSDEDRLQSEGS